METTEQKIDRALNEYQELQDQNNDNQIIQELQIAEASNTVLGTFLHWASETKQENERSQKFKQGLDVLVGLLRKYNTFMSQIHNEQRKTFYWQMKYEGVKDMEAAQEKMLESLSRLLDENQELKEQLKQTIQ